MVLFILQLSFQVFTPQALQVKITNNVKIDTEQYTSVQIDNPEFFNSRNLTLIIPPKVSEKNIYSDFPVKINIENTNDNDVRILSLHDLPPNKQIVIYLDTAEGVSLYNQSGERIKLLDENERGAWLGRFLLDSGITTLIFGSFFFFMSKMIKNTVEEMTNVIKDAEKAEAEDMKEIRKIERKIARLEKSLITYKTEALLWTNVMRNFFDKISLSRLDQNKFFKILREKLNVKGNASGSDVDLDFLSSEKPEKKTEQPYGILDLFHQTQTLQYAIYL